MTTFVFLGAYSEVLGAGIKLTRFGERVELSPDLAAATTHPRGLPCIPAEAFDAITPAFTAEELRRYGAAATHENAPAEFLAKKRRALELLADMRSEKPEGK